MHCTLRAVGVVLQFMNLSMFDKTLAAAAGQAYEAGTITIVNETMTSTLSTAGPAQAAP